MILPLVVRPVAATTGIGHDTSVGLTGGGARCDNIGDDVEEDGCCCACTCAVTGRDIFWRAGEVAGVIPPADADGVWLACGGVGAAVAEPGKVLVWMPCVLLLVVMFMWVLVLEVAAAVLEPGSGLGPLPVDSTPPGPPVGISVLAVVPASGSLLRFVPRVELSLSPSEVALMRIWCLVLVPPHCSTTQSHSISPPVVLLSSASFRKRSVSSSDHAPWFPTPVIVVELLSGPWPVPIDEDAGAGIDAEGGAAGGAGGGCECE